MGPTPEPAAATRQSDVPRPAPEAGNLTRLQRLIWVGQKLAGRLPLYNMIHTYRYDGTVDPRRFGEAFRTVVQGSDALRSVFEEDAEGTAWQRVTDLPVSMLEVVDLTDEPDPERGFDRWLKARIARGLDLDRTVYDAALLRLAADRFVWYLNVHHIVADGWAFGIIQRRLTQCYEAIGRGQPESTDAWPRFRSYRDLEHKQRDSERARKVAAFWAERREQPSDPVTFYGGSPQVGDYRTRRVSLPLGEARSRRLREAAGRDGIRGLTEDLSLLGVFTALLQVYVHRVSGAHRFAMGMPFHNRMLPPHRETVGLLMEVGLLRADLCPSNTFFDVIAAAQRELTGVLRHVVPGCTSAQTNACYGVLLNFVRSEVTDLEGLRPTLLWHHSGYGDAGHMLRLQVEEFSRPGEFTLHFDLAESVFPEPARAWVTAQFRAVVDAFVDDPAREVGAFTLMSDAERVRLVETFNATVSQRDSDLTVPAAILARCRQHPAAPAVQLAGPTTAAVDYQALARRVAGLSGRLRAAGVARGDRVAILLTRRPEVLDACLAAWWAGAAYVPLDPAHPDLRLAGIVRDAAPTALVTENRLEARLPDPGCPVLSVDTVPEDPAEPLSNPLCEPDDLAYLMYTSGSTGTPKGVMVSHGNLADYISWAATRYADGEALTFPLYSSMAFDLTVTSLWVPLVTGGCVRVYPERSDTPGLEVLDVFRDDAVDVLKLTPAHLALALETDHSPTRLRRMILGGEDFKRTLATRAWERFEGRVELINEYGPTEVTVGCMIHRFDPDTDAGDSVPIGVPAVDAAVYVMDRAGQLAPPGVVGEICVSGPGVAQGYHGLPDATGAVFTEDRLRPGVRLYRTGDLAAWTADDTLRFLGRGDDQVKVRGARIELGEVEAQVLTHPQVSEAAVRLIGADAGTVPDSAVTQTCAVCGMDGRYPGLGFDSEGVCNQCRDYATYRDKVKPYFRAMPELKSLLSQGPASPEGYDCMVLLSGGKDSTYALCRVVDQGFKVLAYTLDNGYLSEQAKTNIRRVTEHLGVDLEFGTTPHMNEIFADSLRRFSNVCNGCFKTLYTLSTNLANEKRIPFIVTGLARGQMFETRLSDMYDAAVFDVAVIDRQILAARKAYHRMPDLIARRLDTAVFADDAVFERIRYVDFYRYCDATLDEMYAYLAERVPWIRPSDTGRSTNCLINDVGIYVHKRERGFHNYALPYSWDVRLGHKRRDAALKELDDDIDEERVTDILDEIHYRPRSREARHRAARLVAYYVATEDPGSDALRRHCQERLAEFAVPARFVRLDALPLTANGKVDRDALPWPPPEAETRSDDGATSGPEVLLLGVWRRVFGDEGIGPTDNFFELGGDSIISIQLVAGAAQAGLKVTPGQIFEHQTVAALAVVAERVGSETEPGQAVTGPVPLAPIQQRFFDADPPDPGHWNQVMRLRIPASLESRRLEEALSALVRHHDMLRAQYRRTSQGWEQVVPPPGEEGRVALTEHSAHSESAARRAIDALNRVLDLNSGRLMAALRLRTGADEDELVLAVHHLAVDGVSWWTLLQDLGAAYDALEAGRSVDLPSRTASYQAWAREAVAWTGSETARAALTWWTDALSDAGGSIPVQDAVPESNLVRDAACVVSRLDAGRTRQLLEQIHTAYNTRINDVLLAAFAATLADWQRRDRVLIALEGHGRDGSELDLSRTVGWFTSLAPVLLPAGGRDSPGDLLRQIKETLRRLPDHGLGHGRLRYLSRDPGVRGRIAALPEPQVLFNYLGQLDRNVLASGRFRPESGGLSLSCGPDNPRLYLLEVNAMVVDGCLRVEWSHHPDAHDTELVERLAAEFLAHLEAIIAHCLDPQAGGATPSDFPDAALDQDELDRLLDDFGEDPL